MDDLSNNLEQESILRNAEQQYHRTSLNIKLCGVPFQPGEEDTKSVSNEATLKIVKHVCDAAKIAFFPDSVDVCHRLGSSDDPTRPSPIIIRFKTKYARCSFFEQKRKLHNFTTKDLDLSLNDNTVVSTSTSTSTPRTSRNARDRATNFDGSFSGGLGSQQQIVMSPIYMQEHLTKRNKDLLKESKRVLKELYEFPGYVMNGEVRAKYSKADKFCVINSMKDIEKLRAEATSY